ncbi:MAG: T9SS type A sorting domain-containing protein [Chitinophagaceae bacterium]|nr:T9SS type A sorting domain-containing protein [Chitinophagaceae bacterium]
MNKILSHTIATLIFLFAGISFCFAQKEANTWYFGNYAGIDFNSGTAVSITNGLMSAFEGCATISDKNTGAILIYTNGSVVWNSNHQVMANGTGLTGNSSSAQAAVIVPDPGNSMQYYIFTAGEYYSGGSDGYRYSIVDLSQNGGLGAVTAVKNVLLYAPACEKLAVIKNTAGTGYWIATHEWNGNNFVCFELTASGISSGVVSAIGTAYSNYNPIGCMKFSTDGSRLATILSGLDQAEVYDFDASSGLISNAINLGAVTNNLPYVYGIAFSPNGKRLYVDEENNNGLFQFDLDAGTLADIIASKTVVGNATSSAMQTMQLGPDGKLYICRNGMSGLAVVNDPDISGLGCNFTDNGFILIAASCTYGLPGFTENVLSSEPLQQVNLSSSDTNICKKFCIDFFDQSLNNPTGWQWEFPGGIPSSSMEENPDNICYDVPGTYDVTLITTNANGNDTLLLEDYITVYPTPPFPVITQDLPLLTSSPAAAYQWQFNSEDIPGATNQSFTVTQSGFYTVIIYEEHGCQNSVTEYIILSGVDDLFAESGVSVYPNPSAGVFKILSASSLNINCSIQISNTLGDVLYFKKTDGTKTLEETVDLSTEPGGIYFLHITAGDYFLNRKLMVVH